MNKVILISVLLMLLSCATQNPYNVSNIILNPKIDKRQTIKKNKELSVIVHDKREARIIGTKRFGFEEKTNILLGDTGDIILNSLADNLPKIGFKPVSFRDNNPISLQLNILSIDYIHNARVISGNVDFNIKAEVILKNKGRIYSKEYNIRHYDQDMMKPSATHQNTMIDAIISSAFEELIEKILGNTKIIYFLHS